MNLKKLKEVVDYDRISPQMYANIKKQPIILSDIDSKLDSKVLLELIQVLT